MEIETFAPFIKSIEQLEFPSQEYFKEVTNKTQVCLHHTASGKGVKGDYNQFLKPGHIATPIIVGHDKVYQLFSSKYWGYHLGVDEDTFYSKGLKYQRLDKLAIGLEIDNWGPLRVIDDEYRAWPNKFGTGSKRDKAGKRIKVVIDPNEVVTYAHEFRGYEHYQKYTKFQIDSTATLLRYWNQVYGIPLNYSDDIWDVSSRALKGDPGVYTHVSYRSDKSDCHPQPELIEMLTGLTGC